MRNNNFLPKETVLRIIDSPRTKEQMVDMIKGIPEVEAIEIREGMTNGDMIKAMFPNAIDKKVKPANKVNFMDDFKGELYGIGVISLDWWNAPYKKEVEENEYNITKTTSL